MKIVFIVSCIISCILLVLCRRRLCRWMGRIRSIDRFWSFLPRSLFSQSLCPFLLILYSGSEKKSNRKIKQQNYQTHFRCYSYLSRIHVRICRGNTQREKEGVRINKGLVFFRFSLPMLSGLDMNFVLMQAVELPVAIFTSIFFPGRYRRDNTGGKISRYRLLRRTQISHRAVRKRF